MVRLFLIFNLVLLCAIPRSGAQDSIGMLPVDYVAYKKSLKTALTEVSRLTSVNIAFSSSDIPDTLISIKAENLPLGEVLSILLGSSGLSFDVLDESIVIYRQSLYSGLRFTLSGFVTDKQSGERILQADIYLEDLSLGCSTNDYGYYHFSLPRGNQVLICSYLGYEKQRIPVRMLSDQSLDIRLTRDPALLLDEVLITALKPEPLSIAMFRPDEVELDALDRMVSLGGEDDIIRLLYSKAGVLTGADGFGGMHVRGGDADQNQILLDGVPVYKADHAIGLYSIFNPAVIQSSRLIKGDLPARYGGSTSSVLDIRTRNGDKFRTNGEVNLGLFTAKAGLEGPLIPGKVSFLVSARRTYADIWIQTLRDYLNEQENSTGITRYFNFDLNAKIHASLRPGSDLSLSYYRGGDSYLYDFSSSDWLPDPQALLRNTYKDNRSGWNNELLSLQWAGTTSADWHLNAALLYSRFGMTHYLYDWVSETADDDIRNYRFTQQLFRSGIADAGAQVNVERFLSGNRTLRFGGKSIHHSFQPEVVMDDSDAHTGIVVQQEIPDYDSLIQNSMPDLSGAWENRVYVEYERLFGNHTRINYGANLAHFYINEESSLRLEPRFLLHTRLAAQSYLSVSATMMSQFMHQVESQGLGFPAQVWLPSTGLVKPQRSWQVAIGLHQSFGPNATSFFQAYYKNMDHLIMAGAGEIWQIGENAEWDRQMPSGLGYSYGLETGFSFKAASLRGEGNYNLSVSRRKFDELNGDLFFDHRFSRRHMFNLRLNLQLASHVDFALAWTYGTGNPYTFPTQIASFVEDGQVITKFIYEGLNNFTLPDYHRLDFEINVRNHFNWGHQKISLGAYNLYNRKNPFYISFDNRAARIDELNPENFKYVYVFPLIPVLNYSLDF